MRLIGNKWMKYQFMKQYASLAPFLPEMSRLSERALWEMVHKSGYAIVKPVNGSRGRGVIQVAALKHGGYELHYEKRRFIADNKEQAYAYIRRITGSTPYLIQWRVPRAKVAGRPFDMRILVQRRKHSRRWTVTGKLAKIVGPGYIVSNITRSKGRVMPVSAAISRSNMDHKQGAVARVERVALLCANKLGRLYPRHRIFGLDVGFDRHGHVWIIEANLCPAMSHFRKLGNRTMVRRILSFKKG